MLRQCAIVILCLLAASPALGQNKVAVVNLGEVSDKYARTAELEQHYETERRKFNEERTARQQRLERDAQALNTDFKPGTPEYDERRKTLMVQEAELKAYIDAEGKKIEQGMAGALRSIYEDIQAVVGRIAQERGIELVVAAERLPPDPPETTAMIRQQIVLMKAIYWDPKVDLTEEVIKRLNDAYAAKQGGAGTPPAEQPKQQP